MYLLYSLLLALGILLLSPRFVYQAIRHRKYVDNLRERFGGVSGVGGRRVLWLHCVSVGEAMAGRLLAEVLREEFPDHDLVVSTTTETGQRVARELFKTLAIGVIYFPFDFRWTVARTLNRVRPSAVLLMETELWPHMIRECRRRGVPVIVVNGRLSQKSFGRYRLIRPFMRRTLDQLKLAIMQTEEDAARIKLLGLDDRRVLISGNLKFDIKQLDQNELTLTESWRDRFALDRAQKIVVAASTHHPEEAILLRAFARLVAPEGEHHDARLLIAPRHPERFAAVADLLKDSDFRWVRRSDAPAPGDERAQIVLFDSIGELRSLYPLARIVFVGGSIAPKGGHNILEPAAEQCCVVTGAHTQNFAQITRIFLEADALRQLPPAPENDVDRILAECLRELLADDSLREGLAARAAQVVVAHRGASRRTAAWLKSALRPID